VEILTIIQSFNFLFWLLNTIFLFLTNLYALFPLMIFVGLMGGASYVNVMYQMLESPKLSRNERELAVTVTSMCTDAAILTASVTSLILDNTAFKEMVF